MITIPEIIWLAKLAEVFEQMPESLKIEHDIRIFQEHERGPDLVIAMVEKEKYNKKPLKGI